MTKALKSWLGQRVLVVSPTPTHPQDHGNRKRVYQICRSLKDQGAYIHFAHYASEHDWRHGRPAAAERQMRETWDAYDLIAPSRVVHSPPAERDHTIDEWQDANVTAFVTWITHVQHFDVVIVNYTWLSFCLDAVPGNVFRILDTHDAFGNRRAMLAQMGIKTEFFHTTPEEEAKALGRTHLVWAIKDSERDYFARELGADNCLTMLHTEPESRVWHEQASNMLRVGVIGARNNVNKRNLEGFLHEALPLFSSYLADIKIVIAGGCAEDFANIDHPNIEIMGPVADVADFYRQIDVVIAPIAISTGLKIKVAEALACGAPLVALAHATEGYPLTDPRHLLPDFRAMAMELIKLAFDRSTLADLAEASHRACVAIEAEAAKTLAETRRQIIAREERHMLVVAPAAALDPRSLLHDHLWSLLNFFKRSNHFMLYLTGPNTPPHSAIFEHFGVHQRVFAQPQLVAALGDQAPANWTAIELGDLLENRAFERAYFMADARADLHNTTGNLIRAYVRLDAIEIAGGDGPALAEFLRPTVPCILMSCETRGLGNGLPQYGIAATAAVPFRQSDLFVSLPASLAHHAPLLILAAPTDPLLPALTRFATEIGAKTTLLDPTDPALAAALVNPKAQIADPRACLAGAKVAVDLGCDYALAGVLREALRRQGTPVITPLRGPDAATQMLSAPETSPATLQALLRIISLLLADGAASARQSETTRALAAAEGANGGWYWLWRDLTRNPDQDTGIEELLGTK